MSASERKIRDAQASLTPKQKLFLEWLVTPSGIRQPAKQTEWAQLNAVNPRTLTAWKREGKFRRAWEARLTDLQVDPENVDEVMTAMRHKAAMGDVPAAKLWLEVVDRFRPKVELIDNRGSLEELSDDELLALQAQMAGDELAARRAASGA